MGVIQITEIFIPGHFNSSLSQRFFAFLFGIKMSSFDQDLVKNQLVLLTSLVNDNVNKYTMLLNSMTKINEENAALKLKLDDTVNELKKTNEECANLRRDLDKAISQI